MSFFSKVNSFAGHVNAAHRNALAAQRIKQANQRLALQQHQVNIAAQAAHAQMLKWQAERDQAAGIDWLDGEIANMKRAAVHDPVAVAVRSRAVLATTPHAESMHLLEHKRALRQARGELESLWGNLSPAAQGDAHAFMSLSSEPQALRSRVETAWIEASNADREHVAATVSAQQAPLWIGGSGFAAIVCFLGVAVVPRDVAGVFVFLMLLSIAAIVFTVVRWPLRVLAARKTAKLFEEARSQANMASQAEASFWSDPARGQFLGAAVRRSPGLREQAWWYTGQDGAGYALPVSGPHYR